MKKLLIMCTLVFSSDVRVLKVFDSMSNKSDSASVSKINKNLLKWEYEGTTSKCFTPMSRSLILKLEENGEEFLIDLTKGNNVSLCRKLYDSDVFYNYRTEMENDSFVMWLDSSKFERYQKSKISQIRRLQDPSLWPKIQYKQNSNDKGKCLFLENTLVICNQKNFKFLTSSVKVFNKNDKEILIDYSVLDNRQIKVFAIYNGKEKVLNGPWRFKDVDKENLYLESDYPPFELEILLNSF